MNTVKAATSLKADFSQATATVISPPLQGNHLNIGDGFAARSFRARDVGAVMDPLVMVDHYVMTEPTFGVHPHAGMSAVSLLFADSNGRFHNRDSLGNNFDLQPGDLYWLLAGSGAVHDESPRKGARVHGLQVFVNLPQSQRFVAPSSLLVRAADMPLLSIQDYCVKVALGESNGVRGAVSPALPMTILDGNITSGGRFSHASASQCGLWVQAIEGQLQITFGAESRTLEAGQAIAIRMGGNHKVTLSNTSHEPVHFVLFDAEQVGETYVQDGPFVMGSQEQIADIKAAYAAGKFGAHDLNSASVVP